VFLYLWTGSPTTTLENPNGYD